MSIAEARQLLELSEPQECITLIEPVVRGDPTNLEAIQLIAEAYLENGNPQNAYECLIKASELDPTGEKGGPEKFLSLGQLEGSRPGLEWYEKGLAGLRSMASSTNATNGPNATTIPQKISDALCGMVEIWMTDLCMEPEAESTCEKLITEALLVSDQIPESWSVLGSIRISQQRNDDAKEALDKSWQLYLNRDIGVEDLPALIRLAQNMTEMEMLEHVIEVTTVVMRIDDQIIDVYYLNGLAHFELYRTAANTNGSTSDEYPRETLRHIHYSKEAFETVLQLAAQDEEADPAFVPAVAQMLEKLPGDVPDYESSEDENEDDEEWKGLEDD